MKTIAYYLTSESMFNITGKSTCCYLHLTLMPHPGEHGNPMKIFGMEPGTVCCSNYSESSNVYLYRKQKEAVIQGVHEYLFQFFGSSINYTIFSQKTTELPPILKHVSGSDIWVPDDKTEEELESYFTDYPIQKYLKLSGKLNSRFIPNSVVYRNEYLKIDSGNYGDEMLHNFKGRHLIFIYTNFRDSTIIQFLNKWKSNQGFQNLKALFINLFDKVFDNLEIMRNIDVKHRKPSEDALQVKWRDMKTISIPHTCSTEEKRLESRDYLIRDGDGQGASVEITPKGLSFVVWNSTENTHIMGSKND
ncbi:hypothetical protein GCK72_017652 [Caenorhabditis remanei]|uniref:F-box associated domain-containing protein n=1 Tax=Caenorhabditis remanei TaxID=31234 RepID=A0A6A5G9A5_CAERE|nr:hypothetical protein GCK72_017652 [Caenorhabditis remanei]KAF1751099.1 hypothetical protein GCK72_017652 [Caenorhabditis remanei]